MANPSSSRHDHDDRERERRHRSERHSSSHHSRTISSTTLLLVLSLILAVLAVMLSIPSSALSGAKEEAEGKGVWGVLTPKRSQALVARESSVAAREAEVARREAELLVGAPGGVIPSQTVCPACPTAEPITITKEVVQESAVAPWAREAGVRAEEILDRELKIAERERDISKREESVNRREHDASRRESWIMEQLIVLGNEGPPQKVEEEYISYEPVGNQRRLKVQPPPSPRRSEL